MLHKLVDKNGFRTIMQSHCEDIIAFLFDENIEFSILTSLSNITFEPILPEEITSEFKPLTFFTLAGYTYESSRLNEGILSFEAGFGRENIGSLVSVPVYAILQILVDNTPIFINLSTPPEKKSDKKREAKKSNEGIDKSMNIFLSNPNNKKLFKKKR